VAAPGGLALGVDLAAADEVPAQGVVAVLAEGAANRIALAVAADTVAGATDAVVADVREQAVRALTVCRDASQPFRRHPAHLTFWAALAIAAGHAGAARAPADDGPLTAITAASASEAFLIRPATFVVGRVMFVDAAERAAARPATGRGEGLRGDPVQEIHEAIGAATAAAQWLACAVDAAGRRGWARVAAGAAVVRVGLDVLAAGASAEAALPPLLAAAAVLFTLQANARATG